MEETVEDALERGKREGFIDATLEQHSKRLVEINGNIKQFAKSVEGLETAVRSGLEEVRTEIRAVQEERRLDQERVAAAAKALAEETERRRREQESQRVERADALAVAPRKWGIISSKAVVVSAIASIVLIAVTYLSYRVVSAPSAPTPQIVTVTTPATTGPITHTTTSR